MKILIIDETGKVTSVKTTPGNAETYTEYDRDTFRVHLSETKQVTRAQVKNLGKILETAGKNKAMTPVTQHSKNVLGFTLCKEMDDTKSKASIQAAYNLIYTEAQRVNNAQNQQQGQQQNQQQVQQQNQQQGQQQNQQQGQQQNQQQGQQQQGQQQNQQQGQQQQNQQQGQQQQGQQGQQQNQQQGQQQQNQQQGQQRSKRNKPSNPDFDPKKDYFWRDFSPDNFWPGMTQAERDKVYSDYWAMVDHVGSIFS